MEEAKKDDEAKKRERSKDDEEMEQQGGLFTLKMWVPREQGPHFQGQASSRP